MSKLLILGAGGHGKVIAETAILMNKWQDIAFLDENPNIKGILGYPVIGGLSECKNLLGEYTEGFVAIGNNHRRVELIMELEYHGFLIPNIIHPTSVISPTSRIGKGSSLLAGAIVNSSTEIGKGCIINTAATIDHDCILQDGVHLSPGSHLGGNVFIGKHSWICIGAVVSNNIIIGKDSIVAAGSTVINDIGDSVMVAGVPAILKRRLE